MAGQFASPKGRASECRPHFPAKPRVVPPPLFRTERLCGLPGMGHHAIGVKRSGPATGCFGRQMFRMRLSCVFLCSPGPRSTWHWPSRRRGHDAQRPPCAAKRPSRPLRRARVWSRLTKSCASCSASMAFPCGFGNCQGRTPGLGAGMAGPISQPTSRPRRAAVLCCQRHQGDHRSGDAPPRGRRQTAPGRQRVPIARTSAAADPSCARSTDPADYGAAAPCCMRAAGKTVKSCTTKPSSRNSRARNFRSPAKP